MHYKFTVHNYFKGEFQLFQLADLLIRQMVCFISHCLIRVVTQSSYYVISSYCLFKQETDGLLANG